ncbi:MAG: hypothetical protein TEF_01310 [Rhizobiales bacterium NRL2]|nr:MAG: hypothetical protein TEF_01310 [Rhizobiales bacterium NRL2]
MRRVAAEGVEMARAQRQEGAGVRRERPGRRRQIGDQGPALVRAGPPGRADDMEHRRRLRRRIRLHPRGERVRRVDQQVDRFGLDEPPQPLGPAEAARPGGDTEIGRPRRRAGQ